MNEDLIKKLKILAERKAWCDTEEFVVYEYAGGNIDDAYEGGYNDGEIGLAREILEKISGDKK